MENLESLYMTGGDVKWYSCCGGKSVVFLPKLKYRITIDSSDSIYITKRIKGKDVNRSLHTMFISAFPTAKGQPIHMATN